MNYFNYGIKGYYDTIYNYEIHHVSINLSIFKEVNALKIIRKLK